MRPDRLAAAGLFSVVVLAWGLNYLFVREGLTLVAPLWLAFFRSVLGAIGIAVYLMVRRTPLRLSRADRRDALLLGIPNTGLFFGLWFLAAGSVPPGVTSVIIYTFPLWVALLTALLTRTVPAPLLWGALATGFAGAALVAEPWRSGSGGLPLTAVVELLVAALSWALGTVLINRRFPAVDLAEANGFQLAGGAALLLLGAAVVEPSRLPTFSWELLGIVLWLGLLGSALAYAIWFHLMGSIDPPRLSALTFLVPVVALVASLLLLDEVLTWVQVGGVGLVLVAIYVIATLRPPSTPKRAAVPPGVTGPSTPRD